MEVDIEDDDEMLRAGEDDDGETGDDGLDGESVGAGDEAGRDPASLTKLVRESAEGAKSTKRKTKKVESGLLTYVRAKGCRRAVCDEYFDNPPRDLHRECHKPLWFRV